MNKNPIVPFFLIFGLGLVLIFFMSLYGLEQKEEITKEENGETEEVTDVAEFDADVALGKCISCHGGDLEGGMGGAAPALAGTTLSKEELEDIIQNGVPGTAMPGGLIPDDHVEALSDYILALD